MEVKSTIKRIAKKMLATAGFHRYKSTPQSDDVYKLAVEKRCAQIAKDSLPPPKDLSTEAYKLWLGGLTDELRFWYLSVALDGWSWSEAYRLRVYSDFSFQFPQYIAHFDERDISCLEVGSGAMASLGTGGVPGKQITIVPTDALATAYKAIFNDFGVKTRFPVIQCDAESLRDMFQPESFHFVFANNCLDHCYDPILAIRQMYELLKPTGAMVLAHHINVAVSEKYTGLHQWNLCEMDARFVIWNKTEKHFVDDELPGDARISIDVNAESNWFTVYIIKP